GLSVVYTDLLNFAGDEIYFHDVGPLAGKSYGDALLAYENAAVIGLHAGGVTTLNPPPVTKLGEGDALIAIAEDENAFAEAREVRSGEEASAAASSSPRGPERTLVLGWNRHGPRIIGELDNYVAPGSEMLVVADEPRLAAQVAAIAGGPTRMRVTALEA